MYPTPTFERQVLVSDDAQLAAQISALFTRRKRYFAVLDGPRMSRPDASNEVLRRQNAIVRAGSRQILLGGLSIEAAAAMRHGWANCTLSDAYLEHVNALQGVVKRPIQTLRWGPNNLGVGLYTARLQRKELVFDLPQSPSVDLVRAGTELLIVCERGDDLAEVTACNLAFACGASYAVCPELPIQEREEWLEELYALGDGRDVSRRFDAIAQRTRAKLGALDFSCFDSVLFVTAGFPWGIALTDVPTTHMYRYPDFGRAVVEGLWAAQSPALSARTALLIDPQTVDGSEIPATNLALLANGTLTRLARGPAATISRVQFLFDLLPHDIIVLSTHSGDASGERITYEYRDDEGKLRRLIVDQALGFGYDRMTDKVSVTEYHHFHSLDGVDWRDRTAKAALPVGSAILAWNAIGGPIDRREFIVAQEEIPRVMGSMAIKLHDGIWLFASHGFAPESAPLIVNNSCWSWHELSERTTFAGARGYVGSLFPVTDAEAQAVGKALFGKYIGDGMANALWSAQRDTYGTSARRPYVMVGLPFVSIGPNSADSVSFVEKAYLDGIAHWSDRAISSPYKDARDNAKRFYDFLVDDLDAFRRGLVRKQMQRGTRKPSAKDPR